MRVFDVACCGLFRVGLWTVIIIGLGLVDFVDSLVKLEFVCCVVLIEFGIF